MTDKQHQIEIEDETTVVRVLSIVFLVLMALIVSSYSDIQPNGTNGSTQMSDTLSTKNVLPAKQLTNNQFSIIKTNTTKAPPSSVIIYN